jgi:hypothetical protein
MAREDRIAVAEEGIRLLTFIAGDADEDTRVCVRFADEDRS